MTSFTLPIVLQFGSTSLKKKALLDSRVTSCFIDIRFSREQNIPSIKTTTPIPIEVIDGQTLFSNEITDLTIPLLLSMGAHQEEITFHLIASPRHSIILGLSWLETHNPFVDWRTHSSDFTSTCQLHGIASTRLQADAPASISQPERGAPISAPVRVVHVAAPISA